MKRLLAFFSITLIITSLQACSGGGDIRESLGLKKSAPDEFMVLSRPPLTAPPTYTLTPPDQAGIRKREAVRDRAREALVGNTSPSAGVTTGERSLLRRANTGQAQNDIRKVLDDEHQARVKEQEDDVSGGLFSGIIDPIMGSEDEVLNADEEEARLREDKE